MSDKEKRRVNRKIEKQIRQGKKKIKLPNGTVLDGQAAKAQKTAGMELRTFFSNVELYLSVAAAATVLARILTAWSMPAGFRVLTVLICVPVVLGAQFLLNTLVPPTEQPIRKNGGGSPFHAVFWLAVTVEFTKFCQFVIKVFTEATASDDVPVATPDALNTIDYNSDGVVDDNDVDPNWQPPSVTPAPKLKKNAQDGITRLFLYGIPFIFGGAVILFFFVTVLRISRPDPTFGPRNLRTIRVSVAVVAC